MIFVSDPDFTLHVGDVRDVLRTLPDRSVDCCVTSPPYWGLRDYGADGQLGAEPTPREYVDALADVFREIRRVLTDTGTVWLNLGDSYATHPKGNTKPRSEQGNGAGRFNADKGNAQANHQASGFHGRVDHGMKEKDLVGIPWRVALALQDDGWYLRSDIIWSKPNPMPESVRDRPTRSHEYVFLLTKKPHYWFDQEAVREPHSPDGRKVTTVTAGDGSIQHRDGERWPNSGRNGRSVWSITTQSYAGAHFATFPEELPRRCILAGCPEFVCRTCGKPRERLLERGESDYAKLGKNNGVDFGRSDSQPGNMGQTRTAHGTVPSLRAATTETLGWSDCGHDDYRAGVVLDPFMGAGTTALVARNLSRHSVGIELNPEYAALAADRLSQLSLLA